MKLARSTRKDCGFTLIEALIVLAVIFVLIAVLLPAVPHHHNGGIRINCINNLRQVSLAFKVWAGDYNDKYPMEVSATNGGTMELVTGPNAFRHFEVMSNELNTPKILFCPAESDRTRQQATTFDKASVGSGQISFTGNNNLCYFVGIDATNGSSGMFLAGDHNLTGGLAIVNGMLNVPTNRPVAWTDELHRKQGNIALGDGSVQCFSRQNLQNALLYTGFATNRLAMP